MQSISNTGPIGLERETTGWATTLAVIAPALVLLALGGVLQAQTYLNHDVAWVLNSSERLLQGGTFGRDIVASNPPLIWWLSAPVAGLANLLSTDPVGTFRTVVLTLIAGVIILLNQGLAPRLSPRRRAAFLAMLALLLTLGVNRDFGQREHLAVALCLPWLLLVVGREVAPGKALLAGVAAGIAICFKPHFLAVPALVWLYTALRARSLRPVLTLDTAGLLLTGVIYVAATWVFARPYLTEVVPLITQVYWGFEHSLAEVIGTDPTPSLLTAAALLLAWRGGWQPLPTLPALAATGFLLAAIAQSKGYPYHFFPALGCAFISLTLTLLTASRTTVRLLAGLAFTAAAAWTALYTVLMMSYLGPNGTYGRQTACLVGMVEQNVPGEGGFMAFSTHPYPGFPVANHADRRWVAATNSRLFLPSITRLRAQSTLSQDAARVLALAEKAERAAALRDMSQTPELVLVDARERRHAIDRIEMDFIAFYNEDPAFSRIWAGYSEIPSCLPGIRAFTLSKES